MSKTMPDHRDEIERELRALFAIDSEDRTHSDDLRVDELYDALADWTTVRNECQQVGCRAGTDGWAYCPDHGGPL